MLMKVFGLAFLFIIRLRSHRSLMSLEKGDRGDRALKNVRKFERLDYQVRKCQLDIEFLNTCYKYSAILTSQIKH